MTRDRIIENLLDDYQEYLSDMNVSELKKITKNNVFTLREAQSEECRSFFTITTK